MLAMPVAHSRRKRVRSMSYPTLAKEIATKCKITEKKARKALRHLFTIGRWNLLNLGCFCLPRIANFRRRVRKDKPTFLKKSEEKTESDTTDTHKPQVASSSRYDAVPFDKRNLTVQPSKTLKRRLRELE